MGAILIVLGLVAATMAIMPSAAATVDIFDFEAGAACTEAGGVTVWTEATCLGGGCGGFLHSKITSGGVFPDKIGHFPETPSWPWPASDPASITFNAYRCPVLNFFDPIGPLGEDCWSWHSTGLFSGHWDSAWILYGTETVTKPACGATLTVIKHVINNNGGSAVASQWDMDVTAVSPSNDLFDGAEAPGVTLTIDPGPFSVDETGGPSGYAKALGAGCSGTAVAGGSYTCTITNDDQPATLTVIKHVINHVGTPAVAGDWTMDVSAVNPSDASFPGAEAPGTSITIDAGAFSVDESGGPAGYYLASSVGCSGTAVLGGSYTCTITNEQAPTGRLTIVKDATPGDDTPFHFTGTGPAVAADDLRARVASVSLAPFTLYDPSAPSITLPNGPGAYVVTEGAVPLGWGFDDAVCTGAAVWSRSGQTLNVTVGRDEQVVCTFYNSGRGNIIVQKVVSPGDAPAQSFTFERSWGANFDLAGGQSQGFGPLPAGVIYRVAELGGLPDGWSLTGASCSDGSDPSSIGLSPNETVTCTFTNAYSEVAGPEGSLTIVKVSDPADGTGFGFTPSANLPGGSFSLNGGGSQTFADLAAGSYSVTENPTEGWSLRDVNPIVCETAAGAALDVVYGASGVTVNLGEDQVVTCTFYNESDEQVAGPEGSLTIIKTTLPAGGTGFGFTTSENLSGPFTLDDGGMQVFTELEPGAYTVTETPAADWEFAQVECDAVDYVVDGASVTVNLTDGEVAVCTFTNGELPYTGTNDLTMPLLLAGLWAILMGLAVAVWSLMREADKA